MRFSIAILASCLLAVDAATVTYNWKLTWVWASPDGFGRPVIGINGAWPPPPIHANLKDTIVVELTNNLGNQSTALHFHGQHQNKNAQMDGAASVTQCALPPGMKNTYTFTASTTGTHWYHAHLGGSYLDGFRGPLIVHDSSAPFYKSFDIEYTMTVSDWYHEQASNLVHLYQNQGQAADGREPTPDSTLINDSTNFKFPMIPGKRYLFRIINIGGFASNMIKFGGHNMTIVEMDGVATVPTPVSQIHVASAQRYGVIVTALPNAAKNFAILSAMMPSMFDGNIMPVNMNQTAYLVYNTASPLPAPPVLKDFSSISEFNILPLAQTPILSPVTQYVDAIFDFEYLYDMDRGTVNGSTYVAPRVPTLYTALSAPRHLVTDPRIYGFTNTVVFSDPNGIVEIRVVNNDPGSHPFHIHGHTAQIVAQGDEGTPANPVTWDGKYARIPAQRDVFMVYANSYAIIRFKTNNPGVWLFHCHIEWHIEAGLVMTFVEAPKQLQAQDLEIPAGMHAACAAQKIPMKGNAGGDTDDWFNMKKTPNKPNKNNWGAMYSPPSSKAEED